MSHERSPENLELVAQLKACAQQKDLSRGSRIHVDISRKDFLKNNIFVGSALVSMYAKCGALVKAQKVFDELPFRNLVSWNGLISGYAQHGLGEQALISFNQMLADGLSPNARTFTSILSACSSFGAVERGKEVFAIVVREGLLGSDTVLGNAVIDMFGKFGALARAQQIFDELRVRNVVTWNTLIAAYCHCGHDKEAFKCFEQMKYEGFLPSVATYSCILSVCDKLEVGRKIHDEISKYGLLAKNCVLCTALVHMYAKCGALAKAQEVFDELIFPDRVAWTALITGYCQHNQGKSAIDCFEQMKSDGLSPDAVTFTSILKGCGSIGEIEKGQKIHAEIIRQGLLGKIVVLWSALVDMYMKCGAVEKARKIFDNSPSRDVVLWTAMISGYCQHGHGEEALKCFKQMKLEGNSPDAGSFACILRACGSMGAVEQGQIYFDSMNTSYGINPTPEHHTCMVDLYGRIGKFDRVMEVLEKISFSTDILTWLILMQSCQIWGNLKLGRLAFEHAMHLDRNCILAYVYMCNIYAAAGMREEAKKLLANAKKVLEALSIQDGVSWNQLITGYCQNGYSDDALQCFQQMKLSGLSPDAVTFSCILKVCSSMRAQEKGRKIHSEIIKRGLAGEIIVLGNALVDMYAKCGALAKAERTLSELPLWNSISWNALIAGYCQHGHAEKAVYCFEQMKQEGLHPSAVTFASVLSACGSLGAIQKGEELHFEVVRKGLLGGDVVLGNALVSMYAKCGLQTRALHVFDELPVRNALSWNAILTGYCQYGHSNKAFDILECMKREGLSPNALTLSAILKVCGSIKKGELILDKIVGEGPLGEVRILGNSLVSMYAGCGALAKAEQVLSKLPAPDAVSWNGLIAGHCQQGNYAEAVRCFELMRREGIAPNVTTFTYIVKACGSMGALEMGKAVHNEIVKGGLSGNNVLGTALVNMYIKCGELVKARELFGHLSIRNAVSWTALLTGYYQLGYGEEALNCFERMKDEGLFPDSVTLSCILKACASIGASEKGQLYMEILKESIVSISTSEHQTGLVNLMIHVGQLEEAIVAMKRVPASCSLQAWFSLLCASKSQGNVNLGTLAFEHAM